MNSEHQLLEVQDPDGNQYTIRLEQHCFTVGRSNDNDIVLPNPDKTISRLHCVLEQQANFWWVVDESSANGTTRKLYVIIKKDGEADQKAGEAYVKMLKSCEGQELIKQAGFVPAE